MIDKSLFVHSYEDTAFAQLELIPFEKQLANHYTEHKQLMLLPDLFGKTVKVSALQFKELHNIAGRLASLLDMPVPDIYVYENYYYTVESKGLEDCWIEMSAKTFELSPDEVTFLLAKEMCAIKFRHTYYYTLIEEALSTAASGIPIVGMAPDTLQKVGRVKWYKWMRVSHYTTDCFAYLVCTDLTTCINAIVKTVLNSVFLARHVNIIEFIRQAERINALNSRAHTLSKMDEQVPYAPYRVKNLVGYASSTRGLAALKELQQQREC